LAQKAARLCDLKTKDLGTWAGFLPQSERVTATVQEITGVAAHSLSEWAIEHANDFRCADPESTNLLFPKTTNETEVAAMKMPSLILPALPQNANILIVGAGPSGLALAAELRRLGIETVTVDKSRKAPIPRVRTSCTRARWRC
jgi:NADH dehydrogenase FAD-containing subunit